MSLKEYFFNTAKSFVVNQARLMYKEVRDNPKYLDYFIQGRIPPELGVKAKDNVLNQLKTELQSDEFSKNTKAALEKGLDAIIESTVTTHKKEMTEYGRKLLHDTVPMALDAALLHYNNMASAQNDAEKIVQEALQHVEKVFEFEELLFSDDIAIFLIKAELNKRIRNVA